MKKTNTQATMQIDIKKSIPIVCDNAECNNDMFMPAAKFRRIPKLIAGSQQDQIIPIEVYICTACGTVPKMFDLNV